MEPKGYINADGKVTPDRTADTIADIGLKITRYNLRRVYVDRSWIARTDTGERFTGALRRDVIDQVISAHRSQP